MFKRTRIAVKARLDLALLTLGLALCAVDALAAGPDSPALPVRALVGTPLEPAHLTATQVRYVRNLDPSHLADVESVRVRAIVEICGATPGVTQDRCLLDFWSASDEELDAALEEYRDMTSLGGAE